MRCQSSTNTSTGSQQQQAAAYAKEDLDAP
jgi:hypothetical protein